MTTQGEAELAIARILATLEKETGALVRDISIRDFDITTFADERPQFIRQVCIRLEPLPGTHWQT